MLTTLNESLEQIVDARAESTPTGQRCRGGKLLASVKDEDGNVIGLIQSP